VRLETVGTVIVTSAALLAVGEKGTLAAGLAGLSISYALNVTQSLNWLVRMASDKESQVVSIERVAEFATMEPEPPLRVAATSPPRDWPSDGQIELRRFSMAYRRGLPMVLNTVSCVINAREKVGICGRTGAGKSSIMVALMRLADVMEGEILIDGLNTLTMGLHDVRCAMAIIPQEATLFKGTLRYNLVSAPTPAPRQSASERHPKLNPRGNCMAEDVDACA
jgi:ATP-binding cassette subfamily C (CFTR/MRP) protein 1